MDHSGREDPKLNEVKAVLQRLQRLSAEAESVGLRAAFAGTRPARRIAVGATIVVAVVAVVLAAAYSFTDLKRLATREGAPKPAATPEKVAGKEKPKVAPDGPPVVQAAALSHRALTGDTPATAPEGGPGSQPPSARPKAADTPITSPPPPAVALAPVPRRADSAATVGPPVQPIDRAKAPAVVRPALVAALELMRGGGVRAARTQLLAMAGDGPPDIAWHLARSYDPNFLGTIPAADVSPDIDEAARWYRAWYAAAVREGLVADSVSLDRIIGSMRRQ